MDELPGLEWKDGVAALPGSDLKFRMNTLGVMEVIDGDDNNTGATPEMTADKPCHVDANNNPIATHEVTLKKTPYHGANMTESHNLKEVGKGSGKDDAIKPKLIQIKQEFIDPEEITKKQDKPQRMSCTVCGKPTSLQHFKGKFCSRGCVGKFIGKTFKKGKRATHQKPDIHRVKTLNRTRGKTLILGKKKELSRKRISVTRYDQRHKNHQPNKILFKWSEYLPSQNAKVVPRSVFQEITGKDPFSPFEKLKQKRERFEVGMLLEGVDPFHKSMICALSVAEVRGFRLRLHFEGFCSTYDFWTNQDSPLIFPCGFCKQTHRELNPPRDWTIAAWEDHCNKHAHLMAPDVLFTSMPVALENLTRFRIGDHFVVQSVSDNSRTRTVITDIIGDQICFTCRQGVRWLSCDSPNIQPLDENGNLLLSGKNKNIEVLSHAEKIAESHGFVSGHKLEAVDPRNPLLIRVATVIKTEPGRIKLHFDGWSDTFDFWTNIDSPDIHPAGWCVRSGHALEPPMTYRAGSGCPVRGCNGEGHVKGSRFRVHHSEFGCPYSNQNIGKECCVPDRLVSTRIVRMSPKIVNARQRLLHNNTPKSRSKVGNETIKRNHDEPETQQMLQSLHRSVYVSSLGSNPGKDMPIDWEWHTNRLPGVRGTRASLVRAWSTNEVARFVREITGSHKIAEAFMHEEIDGEALLLLSQQAILQLMEIKLGPALKIYNAILMTKLNE